MDTGTAATLVSATCLFHIIPGLTKAICIGQNFKKFPTLRYTESGQELELKPSVVSHCTTNLRFIQQAPVAEQINILGRDMIKKMERILVVNYGLLTVILKSKDEVKHEPAALPCPASPREAPPVSREVKAGTITSLLRCLLRKRFWIFLALLLLFVLLRRRRGLR